MEYKRMTFRDKYGCASFYTEFTESEAIEQFAELEDKIERGELVENKVITHVNMARSNGKTLIQKALWYDELKAKIEQGTLIELPCKYGELLFKVCSDRDSFGEVYRHIEACRVDEIMIFRSGGFVVGVREINTGYGHNGTLGDTLFFTFEEAEKRLKELRNGI